ncbi:MAG: cysteinyl-tRNA synthetase [Clostridiales bacterium]|jgi:cysteinyl-tRNA synthetase|nr:cysteinyl-tRNA synthetase [Clostridiales bacterium]
MKIYNSMTRKKETFVPIEPGKVRMYVCGPTVYNYFHIGNARVFVVFDAFRRYLEYRGYDVTYIQNFTDVDDKIIKQSIEEHISNFEVSEKYIEAYFQDADALGIHRADHHPKVTETMDDIIAFVGDLIENGYAYVVDGNVYFSVDAFKGYGKLSGQSIEDLQSGARIDVSEEKRNPLDFALWKKKKEGEPFWKAPWGEGRPGWHIECSAMCKRYLGDQIDIHAGGQDLIFPHHENEIAQSEAHSGKSFAKYWMHNGYINIDNQKMSKSLGNFFTARDILKQFDPATVRFFILSAHYRSPVNFSKELVEAAQNGLERLKNARNNLEYLKDVASEAGKVPEGLDDALEDFKTHYIEALDDDFNTADGIAAIFELVRYANTALNETSSLKSIEKVLALLDELTEVLGIVIADDTALEKEIEQKIEARQLARKNRDFALADAIRDELKAKGIVLEDTAQGVKWHRAN